MLLMLILKEPKQQTNIQHHSGNLPLNGKKQVSAGPSSHKLHFDSKELHSSCKDTEVCKKI